MLETLAIVCIVIWLLGMVSGYTLANFVWVFLVIGVVLFFAKAISTHPNDWTRRHTVKLVAGVLFVLGLAGYGIFGGQTARCVKGGRSVKIEPQLIERKLFGGSLTFTYWSDYKFAKLCDQWAE